ncbi:hypothetical protein D3C83_41040 [compost metagenome]
MHRIGLECRVRATVPDVVDPLQFGTTPRQSLAKPDACGIIGGWDDPHQALRRALHQPQYPGLRDDGHLAHLHDFAQQLRHRLRRRQAMHDLEDPDQRFAADFVGGRSNRGIGHAAVRSVGFRG